MMQNIDFSKLSSGIPSKGEETKEDVKYWRELLKVRDEEWARARRQNAGSGWLIDTRLGAVLENLYAIPQWWLKENDK
jgi:hypothetical protein